MTTSEQQAVPVAQEVTASLWLERAEHCNPILPTRGSPMFAAVAEEMEEYAERKLARFVASLPCKSGEGAGEREAIARIVYEAMQWAASNREVSAPPSWVHNGNSFAQCEARTKADSILALRADATQTREAELVAACEAYVEAYDAGTGTIHVNKQIRAALNARGGA